MVQDLRKPISLVLPPYPRTRKLLASNNLSPTNIRLIDPVSYFDMIALLNHCKIVLTDSGGLQKEAYLFKKPSITLRDEPELIELIDAGFNTLIGADSGTIVTAVREVENKTIDYSKVLY